MAASVEFKQSQTDDSLGMNPYGFSNAFRNEATSKVFFS